MTRCILVFWTALALIPMTEANEPISVRISFIEALAPRDTTSSERFQKDFESTISLAKGHLSKRASACGYQLETQTSFYDASDPLQAKERGEQASKIGSWLIVGPRRSNHYLLLAQGAPETASVSLMASANEVGDLGPLHRSLSPLNTQMALEAAKEAKSWLKPKTHSGYIAIVAADCVSCRDFAVQFEKHAKKLGLKPLETIQITEELPALKPLANRVLALHPAFILIPNYSKTSSHLMAGLTSIAPDVFFVGGDGWGDSTFGFVQNGRTLNGIRGITVRGFPPVKGGLADFPLGKELLGAAILPSSGPDLAILRTLDSTVTLLCQSKPKSKSDFGKAFGLRGPRLFSAPWGVSLYRLNQGNIVFDRQVRGSGS